MKFCNIKEEDFLNYVRVQAPNKSSAISQQQVAAYLKTSTRQVRAMKNHLVTDHLIPICSTVSDGLYFPATRQEAQHAINGLASRRSELDKHINCLESALDEYFSPQLQLEVG